MKRLACVLALFLFTSTLALTPRLAHAARVRAASGLQLSIITPDSDSIGDKLSIDVSFRGSTVQSV